MARKILLMAAAIMALSVIALAATKPNFSGTWTMDRARSLRSSWKHEPDH